MSCNCGKKARAGTWVVIDPMTGECLITAGQACVEFATPELASAAGNQSGHSGWGIREQPAR